MICKYSLHVVAILLVVWSGLNKILFGASMLDISFSGSLKVKAVKLLYATEVYETIRKAAQSTSWSRS